MSLTAHSMTVGLDELHQVAAGSPRRCRATERRGPPTPTTVGPTATRRGRELVPGAETPARACWIALACAASVEALARLGWNRCTDPRHAVRNRTVSASLGAVRGLHRATNSTPEPAWVYTYASLPRSSTRSTTTSTPPESVRSSCSGRMPKVTSDSPASYSLVRSSRSSSSVESPILTPSAVIGSGHQVHRGRSDEAGDEGVGRLVVELVGRGELLQLAEPQHGHPVAHRHGLDLVVGDVDGGDAEPALQRGDLGAGLHAQLGVEVRQRLVHAEDLRLAARWRGPSRRADADRRTAWRACGRGAPVRSRTLAASSTFLRRSLGRYAAQLECEAHVLGDGLVRVQRVVLEHHRDVAVAWTARRSCPCRRCSMRPSSMSSRPASIRSAVLLPEPDGPDQDDELAVLDVQVERVNRELVRTARRCTRRSCR